MAYDVDTCSKLEDWIKANASTKIDGTYVNSAFRFVASQRASYLRQRPFEITILLMRGVKPMDEQQATEWLRDWHGREFEDVMCDECPDVSDPDQCAPYQRARIEKRVNATMVRKLKKFFGV